MWIWLSGNLGVSFRMKHLGNLSPDFSYTRYWGFSVSGLAPEYWGIELQTVPLGVSDAKTCFEIVRVLVCVWKCALWCNWSRPNLLAHKLTSVDLFCICCNLFPRSDRQRIFAEEFLSLFLLLLHKGDLKALLLKPVVIQEILNCAALLQDAVLIYVHNVIFKLFKGHFSQVLVWKNQLGHFDLLLQLDNLLSLLQDQSVFNLQLFLQVLLELLILFVEIVKVVYKLLFLWKEN